MKIDILTLFPETVNTVLGESIIGNGQKNGFLEINCHQIRDYTKNKQKQVDDYPYGGGMGMVMQADPLYQCLQALLKGANKPTVILMSPRGSVFNQQKAIELSKLEHLVLVCGHYEGVDQRFIDECVDFEMSIGDYVLTGGEIAAMAVCDSVCRLVPGVLADEECFIEESHYNGLLEYPHYSRPETWHDKKVPEILLSGHHENIRKWRREQSVLITLQNRNELIK